MVKISEELITPGAVWRWKVLRTTEHNRKRHINHRNLGQEVHLIRSRPKAWRPHAAGAWRPVRTVLLWGRGRGGLTRSCDGFDTVCQPEDKSFLSHLVSLGRNRTSLHERRKRSGKKCNRERCNPGSSRSTETSFTLQVPKLHVQVQLFLSSRTESNTVWSTF